MKHLAPFLFLAIVGSVAVRAQSIAIEKPDTSTYPTLRVRVIAVDAQAAMLPLGGQDVRITEDGVPRTIVDVTCPPQTPAAPIALILALDLGGSALATQGTAVRAAARACIRGLRVNNQSCAITAFDTASYLCRDFTNNRAVLLSTIDALPKRSGASIHAALMDTLAGAVAVSSKGNGRRMVVLITDGATHDIDVQKAVTLARLQQCTIYAIVLGTPASASLQQIVAQTGGSLVDNVASVQQAEQAALMLVQTMQGTKPCEVTWQSKAGCAADTPAVELTWQTMTAYTAYATPLNALERLEIAPADLRFINPPVGVPETKQLVVRARNADITVRDIVSSNPAFSITPVSFTVTAGDSVVLTLQYTAADSGYAYARFTVDNDACPISYHVSGGYAGIPPATSTLRLTHPASGETLLADAKVVIRWEGVAPSDTVRLDYTTNDGSTWNTIAPRAGGLQYTWTVPPALVGRACRIRVMHGPFAKEYDPNTTGPQLQWQFRLGESQDDQAFALRPGSGGTIWGVGQNNVGEDDKKLIFRFDTANGVVNLRRDYGDNEGERLTAVLENADSTIVVVGIEKTATSYRIHGKDEWSVDVEKLNAGYTTSYWRKWYGGSSRDYISVRCDVRDVVRLTTGDYVVAASVLSQYINGADHRGLYDFSLFAVSDSTGALRWQKFLGGSGEDTAHAVIQTRDGSLVVAGLTHSSDKDVTNAKGWADGWVVKLDPNTRDIIWQRTLGGSSYDYITGVIEASDGSYVVVGGTKSSDGDLTTTRNSMDAWVVKLDPADGRILWQKTYGGSADDYGRRIRELSDGTYTLIGTTSSVDGEGVGSRGMADVLLVNLQATDGAVRWHRVMGGSAADQGVDILLGRDDTHYVLANTASSDRDAIGKADGRDVWYAKLQRAYHQQRDSSAKAFSVVRLKTTVSAVDVGGCEHGGFKDTVILAAITNPHAYPLDIRDVAFSGLEASAFSFVVPPYRGVLAPGQSMTLHVRFRPLRSGPHNAGLRVVSGVDTTVSMVSGSGFAPPLPVLQPAIDFGRVTVGTSKDSTQIVAVRNAGNDAVTIASIRIGWPASSVFTVQGVSDDVVLAPGDTLRLAIRFAPSDTVRSNTTLVLTHDNQGSPTVIRLFGAGERVRDPEIQAVPTEVTLRCAPDTTFITRLRNIGGKALRIASATITGQHAASFTLLTPLPIVVPPGDSLDLRVATASAIDGVRRATMLLRTNIAGADSVYWLSLHVQQERVDVGFREKDVDVGLVSFGTVVRPSVHIYNGGTVTTSYALRAPQGVLVDTALVIERGQTAVVQPIIASPSKPGPFTIPIILTDNICGRSDTVIIRGRGDAPVPVRTTIAMDSIEATVGQEIEIEMSIIDAEHLDDDRAPRRFQATIELNPTVLHITDPAYPCVESDAHTCQITLQRSRGNDATLLTIPAMVTLGTTDHAPIRLVAFQWLDSLLPMDVTLVDGLVRVTGLCVEGGPRLFVPKGSGFSIACLPNPATSVVELHYGVAEVAPVTIEVVDRMGRVVLTPVTNNEVAPGTYVRQLDVSLLGAGPYLVVLRSTNATVQTVLVVVR